MRIAIVGAGLAGLACAARLQAGGHTVTVYEKSRGVSGRMSTRRSELGGFDHGAQYFTATTDSFRQEVARWQAAGWVEPWNVRLATLSRGVATPVDRTEPERSSRSQRYVAVPGMNALGKHLAAGLDIRCEQLVQEVIPFHDGSWMLRVERPTVEIPETAGPFDALLIAVPANQAVPLLSCVANFSAHAARTPMAPCWTMMLAFDRPLDLPFDGAWVQDSRLGWIACDSSKPQRRPGEHWIANATSAWSAEHLEDDADRAKEKLLRAFHEATGSPVQPVHVMMHRWRYAQSIHPLDLDCLWDDSRRIGACGDWFAAGLEGSGRVENAWRSGSALADRVGA